MKIVHALGWYYPESLGGTEVYVAGLTHRLQAAGHDVWVAVPDPASSNERTYEHEGVPVYRFPIPSRATREQCQGTVSIPGAERFHTWLGFQRPDVVHFHSFVTGLGLPELRAAKAIGARIIATNHLPSLGFVCQRGTLMRWGESLCDGICQPIKCSACELQHRGLHKMAAWSAATAGRVLGSWGGLLPGKLGTALQMTDLIVRNQHSQREMLDLVDRFVLLNNSALEMVVANGAPRDKLALNRLGLSHTDCTPKPSPEQAPTQQPISVGYLGRLVEIKGVFDLARAITSLPKLLPLRLEFRGPINNAESREVVAILRNMLADDPRVTFAEAVNSADVPKILAAYDVLCCPSVWFENGPTVVNEAHAVGTPVIGTRIGAMPETITDGVNGRLVAPRDWEALARVLQEMATSPHLTIDRWRRALPRARTMDEIASDYLELYRECHCSVAVAVRMSHA